MKKYCCSLHAIYIMKIDIMEPEHFQMSCFDIMISRYIYIGFVEERFLPLEPF